MEQQPSVARIVHFTGDDGSGPYAAVITDLRPVDDAGRMVEGGVALATLGPRSLYFQPGPVPFDAEGKPSTWRWPPRV